MKLLSVYCNNTCICCFFFIIFTLNLSHPYHINLCIAPSSIYSALDIFQKVIFFFFFAWCFILTEVNLHFFVMIYCKLLSYQHLHKKLNSVHWLKNQKFILPDGEVSMAFIFGRDEEEDQ